MTGTRPAIPEVAAPRNWADPAATGAVPDREPERMAEAVAAFLRSGPAAASESERADVARFAAGLRAALAGPSRSALVTDFPPGRNTTVTALVAALLGETGYASCEPIGGPVSVVTSGARLRHDQAWHTDSTPWARPNRWTVLGLLRQDPRHRRAPTGVLPWTAVDRDWDPGPSATAELSGTALSWRTAFPGLPALTAPVRAAAPRWMRPAVEAVRGGLPPGTAAALDALDRRLSAVTGWYEAVVEPGTVLVFDNHAALHRGPEFHEPSRRTLLRIKVSGLPLGPEENGERT